MEKKEKTIRVTLSLGIINDIVLTRLKGIKGSTKSAVINKIIEEWIEYNSQKFIQLWNIDLIGLIRVIQEDVFGITIERDINKIERMVIDRLPNMFKKSKSISVKKIAEHLHVNPKTIEDVVFLFGEKLVDEEFDFYYEDGKVIKYK